MCCPIKNNQAAGDQFFQARNVSKATCFRYSQKSSKNNCCIFICIYYNTMYAYALCIHICYDLFMNRQYDQSKNIFERRFIVHNRNSLKQLYIVHIYLFCISILSIYISILSILYIGISILTGPDQLLTRLFLLILPC